MVSHAGIIQSSMNISNAANIQQTAVNLNKERNAITDKVAFIQH
jgi:hypothetical protein